MTVKQLIGELQKYDSDLEVLFVDLFSGDISEAIYLSKGQNVANHSPCVYLVQDFVKRNPLHLRNLPLSSGDVK